MDNQTITPIISLSFLLFAAFLAYLRHKENMEEIKYKSNNSKKQEKSFGPKDRPVTPFSTPFSYQQNTTTKPRDVQKDE
jgi:hypothetical protein